MNTNETANQPKDSADDGFISFSNDNRDNPSSNWRKTPFKSYNNSPHQNRHEQFSPFHGSPQGFSSPIYHQRNGNRRQSGNSYGDRFRGNQSYGRGNNWKNRNDNRKPYHNRSFNKSGCEQTDISEYFHPSMIQDPWRHLLQKSSETPETNTIIDKNCEDNGSETKEQDESGGSSSNSPST